MQNDIPKKYGVYTAIEIAKILLHLELIEAHNLEDAIHNLVNGEFTKEHIMAKKKAKTGKMKKKC